MREPLKGPLGADAGHTVRRAHEARLLLHGRSVSGELADGAERA